MLRITKNHFFGIDAPKLDINILQYNYYCGIEQWDNRNVVAPFWYFWRNEHSGAGIECGVWKKNITAGTIVLIPPNTVFSTTSAPTPFNQLYIHFTVDEPLCPVRRQPVILPGTVFDADPEGFFRELPARLSDPIRTRLTLYELIYRALLLIPREMMLPMEKPHMDSRVEEAISFMTSNLRNSPDNRKICAHINMSVNHFIRLFRNEIGISPQQYMLAQRIGKAKNLLLHTHITIDEISDLTGFADRFHFSKTFRRLTSISPSAFRKSAGRVRR